MIITKEMVAEDIASFRRRCQAARNAGGIALQDVVNGDEEVPEDWWFDRPTSYYLPPNVLLERVW